jgi:hypothetical protein
MFFADSAPAEGQVHGAGNPPNCFRRLRRRSANRASCGSTRRQFNSPPWRGSSIRLTPPTAFALSNPVSCWSGWNHPVLNAPHSIKSKPAIAQYQRPLINRRSLREAQRRSNPAGLPRRASSTSQLQTSRDLGTLVSARWRSPDTAQALCDLAGIESSTRPTPNHRLVAANR